MPRLHKLRRKQKFQFNRNRKRIQNSLTKSRNENLKIPSAVLRAEWDAANSLKSNLTSMGLAFDANQAVRTESTKAKLVGKLKSKLDDEEVAKESTGQSSSSVVQRLSEEAEKATAEAAKARFRFSKDEIVWITYMMDNHGDDFKAMARDPKNAYQLTPKQIRQKVVKFINTPEQFAEVAKSRGMLDEAEAD